MPTGHSGESATGSSGGMDGAVADGAGRTVAGTVDRMAVWAAIALPFLSVPMLVTGVETHLELWVVLTLLVANVLAIVAAGREPTEEENR